MARNLPCMCYNYRRTPPEEIQHRYTQVRWMHNHFQVISPVENVTKLGIVEEQNIDNIKNTLYNLPTIVYKHTIPFLKLLSPETH